MAEQNNSTPIESLTVRAFVLLRKLIKTGKLTEAETIEYVEIQKEMPSENFDAKLDNLNTKYNVVIWLLGILVATGILGFLANIFNWGAS